MPRPTEGTEFGHYRLNRLLGSGGMGEVYLARDLALERDVAIKFVTADVPADRTLTRRLVQEAKAVASLDHPCICPVYEVGTDAKGRAFMVMQYVQGETLAARLKRGPLSPAEAVGLCVGIAAALSVAHESGVVHRDLKPQNVIVTPAGQPKLVDFGIAKILTSKAASEWQTASALTDTYALVGTPAYMSPEQAHQRPVDGRSDLFALGSIFFESLTGRRAFQGQSQVEVLANIVHVQPPLVSQVRPELGTRYDDLSRRLMAKKPEDRFQSAAEAAAALISVADANGIIRRPSKRAVAGISAALVLVAATISAPRWLPPRLPHPPANAQRWFVEGAAAVRAGSYHSGIRALERGLQDFPQHPMAYLLLAEARRELDDMRGAERELVRLSDQFPDQSRLPEAERARLEAVRAMLLGKFDQSVDGYGRIAQTQPADAGAWIDLGRAQEAAGQLHDAKASYQRATSLDKNNAAAHVRFSIAAANDADAETSKDALAEAERLYEAASDPEGRAEVLIRRGVLLDNTGNSSEAADVLRNAVDLAQASKNPHQVVRAQMRLSSAIASMGRFSEAEELARTAVATALQAGWQTTAADGLINFGNALMNERKYEEADVQLTKAIALAEQTVARRTAARAKTQRAALFLTQGQRQEALTLVRPQIEFFRAHNHRLQELDAVSIAARAYQELDEIPKARELTLEMLKLARDANDRIAQQRALASLSGQETAVGNLPQALEYRRQSEDLTRKVAPDALPYELLNRAELLIRLGRLPEAGQPLEEVEAGIAKGTEGYGWLAPRVHLLRAFAAIAQGHDSEAATVAARIDPAAPGPETATGLGPALLDYANAKERARRPRTHADGPPATSPLVRRERRYWIAAAHLAARDGGEALKIAEADLQHLHAANDELRWRLAAVAAAAARQVGDATRHATLRATAGEALTRLRLAWGAHVETYESRKDLAALRAAADL